MTRGAAFFDLDRTLVSGATGEVFFEAMRAAGLTSRPIPGERFLFGLFNTIGETLPAMVLTRQGASLAKGRPRQAVRDAARDVADRLVDMVQPFAYSAFAGHRQAGRPIVVATTTPVDLVEPFAEALGLDGVIATRYGVDADGLYDGTLDGPFVWSAGKLSAVTSWAAEHGIDLAESWAYSDSVYDTPLLAAVGHPVVVNPDPRMVVMAAARRWPTIHFDVPPGVAKVPVVGVEIQRLAMQLARPSAYPYVRFDIAGTENIPADGAAILCGNHRSYFDPAAMSVAIARGGRPARFLGKKEVFDAPVVGQLASAMGGIRVDRGTGSDEPLEAAIDALKAGEMLAMMPQGTIPRGPAFFSPKLKGRWGAARLHEATGAPVIPIGLWGTEKVWPRSGRVPNVFNLTNPPTVRIRVGEPVHLKGESLENDTKKIMKAIRRMLPDEAREQRDPTPEELALTYPAGWSGDPGAEESRRPGLD